MFLKNQRGQMAIFIALFFQVLFVFFAMAINVGMVIHDKINLQNSVDLAAYYGAMKQGEILNQISHINYQMRQNYKLFVYRYRVLGSMGMNSHPYNIRSGVNSVQPEGDASATIEPSFCVASDSWREYFNLDSGSNMCRLTARLPNIPSITGGSGIVPGFGALVSFVETARTEFTNQCNEAGIFNWLVAARTLAHFRVDGAVRKKMIRDLASKLGQPGDSMTDLRNELVRDGVERTLRNNLTAANNNDSLSMEFFNSMGEGSCSDTNVWLPEVQINPVIFYNNFEGTNSNGCAPEPLPNREGAPARTTIGEGKLPSGFADAALAARYRANNTILEEHWRGEPDGPLHSSVGFEKNPWCMAYVGVNASTQVSKPFSPTGAPVQLQARGFAKPFGGRIGPWYGRSWPAGSATSQGNNRDQMVDPLLPSRNIPGGAPSSNPDQDLANHSRFIGDTLGMNSLRALTAMIAVVRARFQAGSLAWSHYNHLGGRPSLLATGDSLARDANVGGTNFPAVQRDLELAATAPDAFDAYYYSIEPSYFDNYFSSVTTNNGASLPEGERVYDFGSSKDGAQSTTQDYNIMRSVQNAGTMTSGSINNYLINNWQHLLTSWHQQGAVQFGLDPARFGACQTVVTDREVPTTGNCIVGGRTGYGVKNVSRDFLNSSDHQLGGAGAGSGPLLNPPTF